MALVQRLPYEHDYAIFVAGRSRHAHGITVRLSGLPGKPELSYRLEVYDDLPFGDVQVHLKNPGGSPVARRISE